MIAELLRLADQNGLTGYEAFRRGPVHWFIDLDGEGRFLSLSPTVASAEGGSRGTALPRGKIYSVPRNYHMQVRDGSVQSVCMNQYNWLPDFLVGPVSEIFPRGADGRQSAHFPKRRKTWRLLFEAFSAMPHIPELRAVIRFLRSRPRFEDLPIPIEDTKQRSTVLKRLAEGKELVSFRVSCGNLLNVPELKTWWASRLCQERRRVLDALPPGADFYQEGQGKLTEFSPTIFRSTIPFVSYDKAPFMSYGLGKQTTPYRLETVEKAAAALNWLLENDSCHMRLGEMTAVFWASHPQQFVAGGFVELLEARDSLTVRDFLSGVWASTVPGSDLTTFHGAILSRSKGRFAVRSWHTETLSDAEKNLRRWLAALAMPAPESEEPLYTPIPTLAACTIRRSKETRPLPTTYLSLFEAALFGSPLPQKLLSAALARQSLEMAKGCGKKDRPDFEERLMARTALAKLYFELTKGTSMSDISDNNPTLGSDAGYLCGRLLALLDKIHSEAHCESGGTNTSPANRSYAAASTTPALIFPQLCKLARYHLNKIGGGWAYCLEHGYPDQSFDGLAAICAKLQDTREGGFPRTLSLEKQGRFAIGFYYERCRCRKWPRSEKGQHKESTADSVIQEPSEG